MRMELTADRLKQLLQYDPLTGQFTWLVTLSSKRAAGRPAGGLDKNGYVVIGCERQEYKAHRLAWLYMTGSWPIADIDHINTVQGDNRWCNLRDVSHATNAENARKARRANKLGLLGVSPSGRMFKAQIQHRGKQKNLGRYETPQIAHEVYVRTKRLLHEGNTL